MTKPSLAQKLQQKAFFRECMTNAGYKNYTDLARHIVLSLPEEAKLTDGEVPLTICRKIAATIGGLAEGTVSPIFHDHDMNGRMRPLALEVACLLSVDPETLFSVAPELANARIDVSSREEERDDRFDRAPDINLIRRDIDRALDTLPEDKRDILLHQYVWGRTQGEIAEEMSVKPSRIGSVLPQVEQAWQNRVKNELKDYFPAKIEGGAHALRRHPLGHIDIPEDFDVSRFANHFVMNATRLNHLISRKDGIPDSLYMRLMEEMDRTFKEGEQILSLPMATGPMLGFCTGSEVASLVDMFAKVGRLPSKNFMRALETVAEKHGRGQPGYSEYWSGTQIVFMKAAQHFLDTEKKSGKDNIDRVYYNVLSYT